MMGASHVSTRGSVRRNLRSTVRTNHTPRWRKEDRGWRRTTPHRTCSTLYTISTINWLFVPWTDSKTVARLGPTNCGVMRGFSPPLPESRYTLVDTGYGMGLWHCCTAMCYLATLSTPPYVESWRIYVALPINGSREQQSSAHSTYLPIFAL